VSEPVPDEELVRRFLAGDAGSFTVLVQRHQVRVYSLCVRVLGGADEAADATQDTFLAIFRKMAQYRGEAAFTTWMHRVTVNACYDVLRKRRRQPLLRSVVADDGSLAEAAPPVADHADEVAGTRDAALALATVPEEFRVALVLADIEDLPYEEIARVLDVPVGTVKSRVHRGRLALARAMGITVREPDRPSRPSQEQA